MPLDFDKLAVNLLFLVFGEIVAMVHGAGLAQKVARLRPMGVIKG
jgi:hypothetical protein